METTEIMQLVLQFEHRPTNNQRADIIHKLRDKNPLIRDLNMVRFFEYLSQDHNRAIFTRCLEHQAGLKPRRYGVIRSSNRPVLIEIDEYKEEIIIIGPRTGTSPDTPIHGPFYFGDERIEVKPEGWAPTYILS